MSSTAGRLPSPASPAYGAANAGLQMLTRQAALHTLGRLGDPADIAAAALFLLSDSSSWITAATLDVSGGRVAL